MALVLLFAGLCLLALPGATRRLGRTLDPAEWSRLCMVALATGAAVVELSLILYGLPTLLRAVGVSELAEACERTVELLLHGDTSLGWPAAGLAVALPVFMSAGARRGRRSQRAARKQGSVGRRQRCAGHEVVVVPTEVPLALAVDADGPQIVVSEGLVARLSPEEVEAVVRHEAAHLELRHQRFLLLATSLEQGFAGVPFVKRSTVALRAALERWADEVATGEGGTSRAVLRRAIVGVATAPISPAVGGFSVADTVMERVEALESPPCSTLPGHLVMYLPGLALLAVVALTLGAWTGQVDHILALAGSCST